MAYTYLIGWSNLDKWYYGVRFSKNCEPSELWVSYFTSSKHVKRFREVNGDPDVIQIRKKFECGKKAIIWESKVLKKLRVIQNDKWVNKSDNTAICPEAAYPKWETKTRQKASNTHKGMKRSEDHKRAISNSLKNRDCYWLKGKKRDEHSFNMSGEKNPRSLRVLYKDKVYGSIKELSDKENMSYYIVKKMINSQEIAIIKRNYEA
jgi:hypothetical protein